VVKGFSFHLSPFTFHLIHRHGEHRRMVVGFNHNFRYKGELYHIQTEDSGLKSPNIVTLLYHGGTILGSKKTSYADIAKVDNLDQVVEELMKEQHKQMLRSLKSGEYDEVISRFLAGKKIPVQTLAGEKSAAPSPSATPVAVQAPPAQPVATPAVVKAPVPSATPWPPQAVPTAEAPPSPVVENSLDEVILSYLIGDD